MGAFSCFTITDVGRAGWGAPGSSVGIWIMGDRAKAEERLPRTSRGWLSRRSARPSRRDARSSVDVGQVPLHGVPGDPSGEASELDRALKGVPQGSAMPADLLHLGSHFGILRTAGTV